MKYFKKITLLLMNLKCLILTSMLVIFSVNAAQAEDIEIYDNLSDLSANGTIPSSSKPNVLFVLDTSTSMKYAEPIESPRPDYNANTDYSDSELPTVDDISSLGSNVYIYTENLSYTGMFVTEEENKCNAVSDPEDGYFIENSQFPQFLTKALLWEYYGQESTQTTCSDDQIPASLTQSTVDRDGDYHLIGIWAVTEGADYQLSVDTTSTSGRVRIYYSRDGVYSTRSSNRICNEYTSGGEVICDSGTIPEGDDIDGIAVTYRNYATTGGITANIEFPGQCTVNTLENDVADWKTEVDIDHLDRIVALECEADSGVHGLTDNGDAYPQYVDDSHSDLSQANYVANETSAVNWASSALPERYLIPENYHNYLQASSEFLLGTDETFENLDGETPAELRAHCKYDAGAYFTQDGEIFQCQRRIEILKKATKSLLETMSGANVGIMRFNYNEGGGVISGIRDIDDTTAKYPIIDEDGNDTTTLVTGRQDLINDLMAIPAKGVTPLQESLYQAYRYFAGGEVINDAVTNYVADPRNSTEYYPDVQYLSGDARDLNDPLIVDSSSGTKTYISPIKKYCQDNNIILFSDGSASSDTSYVTEIEDFSGKECDSGSGGCLSALAYGLANKKVNTSFDSLNHVYTHTVGFGQLPEGDDDDDVDTSQNVAQELIDAANEGRRPGAAIDSQAYAATDIDGLTSSFQQILSSITQVDGDSFVAPAVSVNAFNRIANNDDVYYALFEPADNPRWSGNVKKYKLSIDGVILDSQEDIDGNGQPAIDPITGFFVDTAQSYWSSDVDGLEVTKGGFAEQLDFTTVARNLYAITKPASDSTGNDPASLTEDNFLDKVDRITRDENDNVLEDLDDIPLGAISVPDLDTNRENIRQWTLGQDVEQDLGSLATSPNYYIGESLHSTPSVISFGTKEESPKAVIFTATNQGLLHAIDARDGKELWSYIPDPDLFKNLGAYFNRQTGDPHVYGLDGEMLFHIERDGVLIAGDDLPAVTKANLFMGQRRGGSKYFAIDVSATLPSDSASASGVSLDDVLGSDGVTILKPVKRKWTISPETIETDENGIETLPFARLGQTWAKPVSATFSCDSLGLTDCDYKETLVLAGGYDDVKYDDDNLVSDVTATSPPVAALGNEIYIVDRETGGFLWKASSSKFSDETTLNETLTNKLVHSFPSSPTVIDSDLNGSADLIYAADISGQIWRFDLRGDATDNNTGGIIADLSAGTDEDANTSRRFYNRLSVSFMPALTGYDNEIIDVSKFNIVLGSGYRAHPLSKEAYPESDANAIETDNRLYVVYDRNTRFPQPEVDANGDLTGEVTYKYTADGEVINNDNTTKLTGTIIAENIKLGGTHYNGFHIELSDQYEKVLNPSITNSFKAITVTYTPGISADLAASETCDNGVGQSRVYVTDLLTGDTSTSVLQKAGLSAEPALIQIRDSTSGESKKVVCVATECFSASTDTSGNGSVNPTFPALDPPENGGLRKLSWWEEAR